MGGQLTDTRVTPMRWFSAIETFAAAHVFVSPVPVVMIFDDILFSDPEDAEILYDIPERCGSVPMGGAGWNRLWGLLMKTFLKDRVKPKQ
ncbi:hypothetical protein QQF64_022978 [Cirrhinus molitorella]|uniref:Uncharacterized protein n=1 Tax=Cirrhinus molitorella TaxID=172907 RepID=A0ABR3L7H4_9TELE